MHSMARVRATWEKASPLMEMALRPASRASAWKAAELYQPAVPVLLSLGGFSKKTPRVSAPKPKAAVILAARP